MVVGKEPKAARDKAESQSKHNHSDSAHDVGGRLRGAV